MVKNLLAMWEIQVQSLHWEDPLRREWLPTSVFLPGEFHGHRSLVSYSPHIHKENVVCIIYIYIYMYIYIIYTHTHAYTHTHTFLEKQEILPFATTCMNLLSQIHKNILISET